MGAGTAIAALNKSTPLMIPNAASAWNARTAACNGPPFRTTRAVSLSFRITATQLAAVAAGTRAVVAQAKSGKDPRLAEKKEAQETEAARLAIATGRSIGTRQ